MTENEKQLNFTGCPSLCDCKQGLCPAVNLIFKILATKQDRNVKKTKKKEGKIMHPCIKMVTTAEGKEIFLDLVCRLQ